MVNNNPCKECKNHAEACHSSCDAYKNWQKEYQAEKERIKKAKETHYRYTSLTSYRKQF